MRRRVVLIPLPVALLGLGLGATAAAPKPKPKRFTTTYVASAPLPGANQACNGTRRWRGT